MKEKRVEEGLLCLLVGCFLRWEEWEWIKAGEREVPVFFYRVDP